MRKNRISYRRIILYIIFLILMSVATCLCVTYKKFTLLLVCIPLLILSIVSFGIYKQPALGLVPTLVMAYGDGFAAVIGQAVKSKEYVIKGNTKSIAGSLTMFVITLMIVAGYMTYMNASYIAIKSILVAIIMTIVEAVSIKGTDNITVPLLTSLLVMLMA